MPRPAVSDEAILEVMRLVAKEQGGAQTLREWERLRPVVAHGGRALRLSASLIRSRFGSWPDAWARAGLEPARLSRGAYSDAYLCEALERLAARLGSSPTALEIQRDPDTPDPQTYRGAFGSLASAYMEAGLPPPSGPREALSRPALTVRKCLRCERPFSSEGPHNRLCEACREANAEMLDPQAALGRGLSLRSL